MQDLVHKIRIYGLSRSFKYIVYDLRNILLMRFFLHSYSQKGEDIIIDKLLGNKKNGLYIDIGAHDPSRFSNTKRFYDRGWKGINIDPNLNLIARFKKERKRDTNLVLGVSKKNGLLTFYEFFPSTLSTFSSKEMKKYIGQGFELVNENQIPTSTLKVIIEKYCNGKTIDFLSIDTEGTDLEVLQSNNWKKYRPNVICVETNKNDKIAGFLKKYGYQLEVNNGINSIFSVS